MANPRRWPVLLKLALQNDNSVLCEEDLARLKLAVEIIGHGLSYRRSAEEARETEFRYRTVADFTYDWEYWRGPEGELFYVSPSVERITGYTAAEFMAEPDLLSQIIIEPDQLMWRKHQEGESTVEGQCEIKFRIRHRHGEVRWIEHACRTVVSPDGEDFGVRVSNRDITEVGRHKVALLESQRIATWEAGIGRSQATNCTGRTKSTEYLV